MHKPALLKEVLEYLNPSPGKNLIDCTFGFGGHTLEILKKTKPDGKVLGIEQDKEIFEKFDHKKRLTLVNDNFNNLKQIVKEYEFNRVDGILYDLGVSSWHFDQSNRGFSFQVSKRSEPLNMSLSGDDLTAEEILNQWPEQELIRIFKEYGEEKFPGRIARVICEERKKHQIKTTKQLVEIISRVVPKKYQYKRIHCATHIFQALRIAVNDELNKLKESLPQALEILEKNGRLVVISFHSLEDRIVKNFFREAAKEGKLEILTKKPIIPSLEEIKLNSRSRSAKLRCAKKI
ncbi:16S rRNA (cytosine(1402)-N(4))-methyltransferase RsmH [Patescibacteria group bacterium]|nr:16S rRNA (cytosine(1402)-N(4))-methyltransferase RsmH [Patescibacteria group bacterium]